MTRSRALTLVAAVVLAVVAGLAWERDGASVDSLLTDADAMYHAQRASRCEQEWPHVSSIDRYSHHGADYRLHWPPYLTLLYTALGRWQGTFSDGYDSVAAVPPVLGALSVLAVVVAAACLRRGPAVALLAGLVTATSGDTFLLFRHGALDHHGVTALLITATVLARLLRSRAGWLAGHLLLFLLTPEAPVYATLLLVLHFGATLSGDDDADPSWLLLPAIAAFAALLLVRLPDPTPAPYARLDLFRLSAFHPVWLGGLGATMAGLRHTLGDQARAAARAVMVTFGGLLVVAAAAAAIVLATGQYAAVAARFASDRLRVIEETPAWADGWLAPAVTTRLLVLAVVVVGGVAALRRDTTATERFGRATLIAVVALGLLEYRHARSLAPLIAIALAAAAADAVTAAGRYRHGRLAAAVLAVLVLAPPLVADALEMRRLATVRPTVPTEIAPEIARWLGDNTPWPGPRDRPAAYGVLCPWSIGHHLNILAERPVIVDPFNHVGVQGPVRRVWLETDDAALLTALDDLDARYLVLAQTGNEILQLAPGRRDELAGAHPDAPDGLAYLSAMRRYSLFRLYLGEARPEGLELRYATEREQLVLAFDDHGEPELLKVPLGQVYERVSLPLPVDGEGPGS